MKCPLLQVKLISVFLELWLDSLKIVGVLLYKKYSIFSQPLPSSYVSMQVCMFLFLCVYMYMFAHVCVLMVGFFFLFVSG